MTDAAQIQASVSARIASEFGQNRLMLIEAQTINEALQVDLTAAQEQLATAETKYATILAENAVLHDKLGVSALPPKED